MLRLAITRSKVLFAAGLCAVGLTAVSPAASAADVTLNLCALPGTATLTGAVSVPIWGFAQTNTPGNCSTATPSLPGPPLSVNEGDTVHIDVTNALPAGH